MWINTGTEFKAVVVRDCGDGKGNKETFGGVGIELYCGGGYKTELLYMFVKMQPQMVDFMVCKWYLNT